MMDGEIYPDLRSAPWQRMQNFGFSRTSGTKRSRQSLILPSCCDIGRICWARTCASPTSAAETPAPSSTRSIRSTAQPDKILWVKGSGGDLGSIKRSGFATLYLEKLLELEKVYRGVENEDEMVDLYPQCTFGNNPVAPSIDTPLHGYLPFPHVDHLHPDWGIALAASANGKIKMEEFNQEFGHKLAWLPWQRPGFELGMMLRRIVQETPGCDGVVLGGHGLFTWGDTQRESYLNTITIIDQLGQFIARHAGTRRATSTSAGRRCKPATPTCAQPSR